MRRLKIKYIYFHLHFISIVFYLRFYFVFVKYKVIDCIVAPV